MAPLKNAKWHFLSGVFSRYELGIFRSGGEVALRKVPFLSIFEHFVIVEATLV